MPEISIAWLTMRNFKSFSNETTVEFTNTHGLKFLTGDNRVEPRLGANGAGKSTLWDALAWCLTGFGTKGQRASELVAWQGGKRPMVAVGLIIDGKTVSVARTGSPEEIEIEAEPGHLPPERVDQKAVDSLLGLSRARLLHSVIFGQGSRLLVDLSVPERGALLDEVLDLGVWLKASAEASAQAQAINSRLNEQRQALAKAEGLLQGLGEPAGLQAEEASWERARGQRLDEAINRVEAAELELVEIGSKLERAEAQASAVDQREIRVLEQTCASLENDIKEKSREFGALFSESQALQAEIVHMRDRPNCPTCGQAFPQRERRAKIATLEEKLAKTKQRVQANGGVTNARQGDLDQQRGELEKLRRVAEFKRSVFTGLLAEFQAHERIVDSLVAQAERIGEECDNPWTAKLAELLEKRTAAEVEITKAQRAIQAAEGELKRVEFWRDGFKRVRLFMIQRSLAHLEIEVAAAAASLGLLGWTIKFATETETRSNTIKQGVQILVSSPQASASWEAWSGGEGQRIRLAVAIGFAQMIQRMAGVDFKFEVWDEPSAWLSVEGVDDLLDALQDRAESRKKAVWMVDHRALAYAGFSEVWVAAKEASGSSISRA